MSCSGAGARPREGHDLLAMTNGKMGTRDDARLVANDAELLAQKYSCPQKSIRPKKRRASTVTQDGNY
jgi:hypothetical protein